MQHSMQHYKFLKKYLHTGQYWRINLDFYNAKTQPQDIITETAGDP